MMAIIVGSNRAELIKIKRKDYDRHFITTRGQLYKIYPDGLSRCVVTRNGKRVKDEEIVVFCENAIVPYHTRKQCYTMAKILSEIDNHKNSIPRDGWKANITTVGEAVNIWRQLAPSLPMIIAGIVVLWAVVFH